MRFRTWISMTAICLFAALAITVQLSAQDNPDHQPTIIKFEAPGAGTAPGQGTFANSINPAGAITGLYVDPANVYHGFLRAPDGTFTTLNAPGAGTGAGQGTLSLIHI